jgi:cyanophycinase-like exopeptidase
VTTPPTADTRLPRLLVVMGSGETSPTMVKTHRALLDRLGRPPVPAVLLDTPFGFQENADDITERAVHYFRESVGAQLGVASFRSRMDASDTVAHERMLDRLRRASYVFAGPGSPSFALRQWQGTAVPDALADKLVRGGCVCFASAAALTLGMATVPVYEIYKVGEDPQWLEGLDLLSATGLRAAVIPHYNNAEGGNHDTRFCYLGERRLRWIEPDLPEGAFVFGVDEHTGCVFDLDAGTATVVGLGVVTVRARGRSEELPSGATVPIAELAAMAERLAAGGRGPEAGGPVPAAPEAEEAGAVSPATESPVGRLARSPLMGSVDARQREFDEALERRDADGAAAAILGLDSDLAAWAADTTQSDELDRARAALRAMVVRLGEAAALGMQDPREAVGPYVELLLGQRAAAREERRFSEADALRDGLVALGVEVMDGPAGTTWELKGTP